MPSTALLPDHKPLAVQDVASLEFHVKMALPFKGTDATLELNVNVGKVTGVMVGLTDLAMFPLPPVQVKV